MASRADDLNDAGRNDHAEMACLGLDDEVLKP